MRTKLTSLLAAAILACGLLTVTAQTNAPASNSLPAITETLSLSSLGDIAHIVGDQIKGISFKDGFAVNPFVLYHEGDLGGGVSVHTANTNGLRVGLALAAVDEHDVHSGLFNKGSSHFSFYDATISIGAKGNFVVPLVGWKLDLYLETGPAFNLASPDTLYIQSVLGASKSWAWGSRVITLQGGIGHLSRWDSPFYEGGLGISF